MRLRVYTITAGEGEGKRAFLESRVNFPPHKAPHIKYCTFTALKRMCRVHDTAGCSLLRDREETKSWLLRDAHLENILRCGIYMLVLLRRLCICMQREINIADSRTIIARVILEAYRATFPRKNLIEAKRHNSECRNSLENANVRNFFHHVVVHRARYSYAMYTPRHVIEVGWNCSFSPVKRNAYRFPKGGKAGPAQLYIGCS